MTIEEIPKIELHRHLEGSIRPKTFFEEAKRQRLELPAQSLQEMIPYLCVTEGEERSLSHFLTKFTWLRQIITNPETLARITFESLEDAWKSGTIYAELRFNPTGMFQMGMSEEEIAAGIDEGMREARRRYGIMCTTISGIMRDRSRDVAERSMQFAKRYAGHIISGVDLFSNEAFPADPFRDLLMDAHQAGLHLTIHAGEAKGAENVKEAIEIGAERIGHGVRLFEDPSVIQLAKSRNVLLEMCPTSNVQTGAVETMRKHPLPIAYRDGIPVCINTDDPGVSNTDLVQEYTIAQEQLGFSIEDLSLLNLSAADYIFDNGSISKVREIISKFIEKRIK